MPVLREAVPADIGVGAYGNGFRRTTSEWLSSDGASSSSIIKPAAGEQYCRATLLSATLPAAPLMTVTEDTAQMSTMVVE